MKKIFTLAMMMVMTITANAMSYKTAKNEALFLSDKMAYELKLTDAQYDDVYEINLDYLMSVNGRNDAYGSWWTRRNSDLKYVLTAYQYEKYLKLNYFYRPLTWEKGGWTFNIYSHYSNKNHFYKGHPKSYTSYKGGHNRKSSSNGSSWRNTSNNNRELAHNTNRELAHNTNANRNNGSSRNRSHH